MIADARLRRRSRWVARAFFILAGLYLLFGPLTLLLLRADQVTLWQELLPGTAITMGHRLITIALNLPQILFEAGIMVQGGLIFHRYAQGDYFARANVATIRLIGLMLMILPFVTAITRTALAWILAAEPPGLVTGIAWDAGILSILDGLWVLTADYLTSFLIGGAVFLLADTQARATALEAEAREIV